jgi:DNA-binding XRE family transcriptional regulator
MGTRLENYVQELGERYDDAERARLDSAMRRFELAGQLLSLRVSVGMTQKQVAERAGLSQADVSRYERGVGNPTHVTIEALARALNAHIEVVPNGPSAGREPVEA